MAFISRQIATVFTELLGQYPILALTGPRQSGKTYLLKHLFPDYTYLSLEDTNTRSFAMEDPVGFLKKYNTHCIFDEVQRVPDLFSHLQTEVDKSGKMGQFILSGSQNFHLMEHITQSLAGRVALFRLLPFDFSEMRAAEILSENWESMVIKGAYPAVFDRNINPSIFYHNYLQTYIDRDVSTLSAVHDLRRFRNFLGLCAARTGQIINLSNLANECGISQPTAKSWLSILETSYLVFQLQPYYENFGKRILKTPKLYFYDTGLAAFLLGLRSENDLENMQLAGSFFENLVVSDLVKQNYHRYLLKEYWFWRDSAGNEIDVLSKTGLKFDAFEIKSTKTVLSKHFAGLDFFERLPNVQINQKYLVYGGLENQERTKYRVRSWNDV